jgi:hypothetical protein
MPHYVAEAQFRYNGRFNGNIFGTAVGGGKSFMRLTHNQARVTEQAVSSRHPTPRDRGVLDRRQAFPRHLIHNVQDPEYSEKKARRLLPAFVKEVLYNLSMTVNRFDCFGPTFRWETGYDDSVVS